MSEPAYYKWKSQFSGMTVSQLSQLRQLPDEKAKLSQGIEVGGPGGWGAYSGLLLSSLCARDSLTQGVPGPFW